MVRQKRSKKRYLDPYRNVVEFDPFWRAELYWLGRDRGGERALRSFRMQEPPLKKPRRVKGATK